MIVAVTGTPGPGKTTACSLLSGVKVIDLRILAEENAQLFSFDSVRGCMEVDPAVLQTLLPEVYNTVILDGHLSHLLENDVVVVLRCSPKVLAERLSRRGWPSEKIRENQEAEAIDLILIEALDDNKEVLEIDTTLLSPREVADAVMLIMGGEKRKYEPGNIDWSEEVMNWY